jgi:hypothetical protein
MQHTSTTTQRTEMRAAALQLGLELRDSCGLRDVHTA